MKKNENKMQLIGNVFCVCIILIAGGVMIIQGIAAHKSGTMIPATTMSGTMIPPTSKSGPMTGLYSIVAGSLVFILGTTMLGYTIYIKNQKEK